MSTQDEGAGATPPPDADDAELLQWFLRQVRESTGQDWVIVKDFTVSKGAAASPDAFPLQTFLDRMFGMPQPTSGSMARINAVIKALDDFIADPQGSTPWSRMELSMPEAAWILTIQMRRVMDHQKRQHPQMFWGRCPSCLANIRASVYVYGEIFDMMAVDEGDDPTDRLRDVPPAT